MQSKKAGFPRAEFSEKAFLNKFFACLKMRKFVSLLKNWQAMD
jgi:hypothetical protein